jgi:hypothetical protein
MRGLDYKECFMKKNSFWALVTSAVIGLVALTGCDTSLDSASAAGLAGFDSRTIDSRSIVVGDYFNNAIWETDDGKAGMINEWNFSGGGGKFVFRHYMNGSWIPEGTYTYTLNNDTTANYDATLDVDPPMDIGGGATAKTFFITFDPDDPDGAFFIDPEPLDMGGVHFVKQ